MNITSKIAGGAGIAWVAVNIGAGMSTGQPPALDASGAEISDYLLDHRGIYLGAAAAFAVTLPLLLTFFGELVARVRADADGSGRPLGSVAQSGLTIFALGFSLAYLLTLPFVLVPSIGETASADLVRTLYVVTFMVTMIANVGAATLLIALAASESALGNKARASAGVIGGVVLVASAAGLASADVTVVAGAAFFVIAVWMLAVGVGMVRQPQPASLSVATPVAA